MLKIVNGSIDKVKAEMKQRSHFLAIEAKDLKKQYNQKAKEMNEKAKKNDKTTKKEDEFALEKLKRKMDEIEKLKQFYNSSSIIPVRVDNNIINFKLYETFMKSLKSFTTETKIEGIKVIILYWKDRFVQPKGRLELYDLSAYFGDFANIPTAEIVSEVESYGA